MHRPDPAALPRVLAKLVLIGALLVAASCGGASAPAGVRLTGDVTKGPTPHAVETVLQWDGAQSVESIAFTVHTKPAHRSRDIHVQYARTYLERTSALEEGAGKATVTVFGLYADHLNRVTVEVEFRSGVRGSAAFNIQTDPLPDELLPTLDVAYADKALGLSYMLLQLSGAPPTIVDIDGEIRWRPPDVGEIVFPCATQPGGLVVGSLFSERIYQFDWLGRFEVSALSDPRCYVSHHNIEPGKTGFFNTVSFQDGPLQRPESVLAEMSASGVVTQLWDFDDIFRDHIEAAGEDASPLVIEGADWFHMNSAVYDATDDSIIASSRENFVVKVDHATGAIRWLLGNPNKLWYVGFPASLQPLALRIEGDPPIGQHSLSLSADGGRLMLFNNGKGNLTLPPTGDTRTYSKVSVYEIDEEAGSAAEVWSFDLGESIYSPYCSSAYWTQAGNVLMVFSIPQNNAPGRFVVADENENILFDAETDAPGACFAYSAQELRWDGMLIE